MGSLLGVFEQLVCCWYVNRVFLGARGSPREMSSQQEWVRFFELAGIPHGIASRYAASFASNRMSRDMLPDLDKATLAELGVTAVGDQLAILRRARDSGRANDKQEETRRQIRQRISAPENTSEMDVSCASSHRRGKPPPDQHEIYHVRMPKGTTAKTRQIMMNSEKMRRMGLLKRSTSGVRQAGRTVLSVKEQREQVSSSTDRFGGLHSDRLLSIQSGRVSKNRIPVGGNAGLFSAAVAATRNGQRKGASGRGQLPRVTLRLAGRVSGTAQHTRIVQEGEEYEDEDEEDAEGVYVGEEDEMEYGEDEAEDEDTIGHLEDDLLDDEEEEGLVVVRPEGGSRVNTVYRGRTTGPTSSRRVQTRVQRAGGRRFTGGGTSIFERVSL